MYRERRSRVGGATLWRTEIAADAAKRVLPDGCMDVVWNGGSLFIAGPDTGARIVAGRSTGSGAGLRFDPGTGPAVLGVPAGELRDRQVPLAEVWPGGPARELAERLAEAADPAAVLEAAFSERPPRGAPVDPVVPVVLALSGPRPGGVRMPGRADAGVRAAAAEAGLSERQLHRRCRAAFGYGMKTLERILRMNRALDAVRTGRPLSEVAAAMDYADQAHLTREVRSLAGLAPSSFAPRRTTGGERPA